MERCTIYSHYTNWDTITNIIQQEVPQATWQVNKTEAGDRELTLTYKKGFLSRRHNLTLLYRTRQQPDYRLDYGCPLSQNLLGMYNFVEGIPAQRPDLHEKLLQKIQTLNTEMVFTATPYIHAPFEQLLKALANELEGIIFTQPNNYFKAAKTPHFLTPNLDLLLDTNGASQVKHLEVKIDAKLFDPSPESFSADQLLRRTTTQQWLQEKGIPFSESLPPVVGEAAVQLRTLDAVIERIYALMITAARSEGVPMETLQQLIKDKAIKGFSPYEEYALNNALPDQERSTLTWRYESLFLLLWAVQLVEDLPFPSAMCPVQDFLEPLITASRKATTAKASLRPKVELLDKLDQTYRLNWACTSARLQQQAMPADLHPGVVYERHYALNWLTNYQGAAWDDVRTDT